MLKSAKFVGICLPLIALYACGDDESTGVQCTDNSECLRSGSTGLCLGAGHCVFTDTACTQGFRVDGAAGANAGSCLYDSGFDDAAWIPTSAQGAALARGSSSLGTLAEEATGAFPVDAAVVLFVREQFTFDAAGFYVQGLADGRAWFVTVDPTTLTPAPAPGDVVRFIATETAVEFQQRQIKSIAAGSWTVYSTLSADLEDYIQDFPTSGGLSHPLFLAENESRLFRGRVTLGGSDSTHTFTSWNAAGPGHFYLPIITPAFTPPVGEELQIDFTELRFPDPVAFEAARTLGLREGCTVDFGPAPMWRFQAFIEFNILDLATQLDIVECDAGVPRTPLSISEVMLADDADTTGRELWFELTATAPVDLANCSVYGRDASTAAPLAASSTMLSTGDRVVVVDSTGLTMPATYLIGSTTVTPTYISLPDLSNLRPIVFSDGLCGDGYVQVECNGTVVDRLTGIGCRGFDPANRAFGVPPAVEATLNRNLVSFCAQTTTFTAMDGATPVTVEGTPGAPNDACF